MPRSVKPTTTRISSKHQATIGGPAFDAAGLREGDVVAVRGGDRARARRVGLTLLDSSAGDLRAAVRSAARGARLDL